MAEDLILSPHPTVEGLVNSVLRLGMVTESRYGPAVEIMGGTVQIPSGALITRDKINYSLGWMETFQLLAGTFDIDLIQKVAPNANLSLFTYPMAYGPRVIPQLYGVIEALRKDPGTRQAVLFIGQPKDGCTSNLPCTITIQFLQRGGVLNAIVHMRSWDLCRGLPYDLMMFSGLLDMMGRFLLYEPGTVTVLSGSTHIYLDQMDKLPKISGRVWEFDDTVPDTLDEAIHWFQEEMYYIERRVTPRGIRFVDQE